MTITARNIGRINVWPTYAIAREADTGESKFTGQLTVWQTNDEALANTSYEEEGGGGAPAWVPANAVIHIDLVGGSPQGRAWVAGTEVAVDTLLGSDPNTENGWGSSSYNPAGFVSNGYDPVGANAPALIGVARTAMMSGATTRFQWFPIVSETTGTMQFGIMSADGVVGLSITHLVTNIGSEVSANSFANGIVIAAVTGLLNLSVSGAINATAMTITNDRLEVACNGSAVMTYAITGTDRPPGNPFVAAIFDLNNVNAALQSITLYDPLPSTAGLSELSEVT